MSQSISIWNQKYSDPSRSRILGRKLENTEILDLETEDKSICPKLLWASRSKSSEATGRRSQGREPRSQIKSRNEMKSRKSRQSATYALERLFDRFDRSTANEARPYQLQRNDCLGRTMVPKAQDSLKDSTRRNISVFQREGEPKECSISSLSRIGVINGTKQDILTKKIPHLDAMKENNPLFQQKERQRAVSHSCARIDTSARKTEVHKSVKINNRKQISFVYADNVDQREELRRLNELVRVNLRKNKEKRELEELHRIEEKDKHRQTLEFLSERNRCIREMNARNVSRSRQQDHCFDNKKTWEGHQKRLTTFQDRKEPLRQVMRQPPLSESERRARLGLVFVDMKIKALGVQAQKKCTQRVIKIGKKIDENNKKRKAIKTYMEKKKIRIQTALKRTHSEAKRRNERIIENLSKLQNVVQNIFYKKPGESLCQTETKKNTLEKRRRRKKFRESHSNLKPKRSLQHLFLKNPSVLEAMKTDLMREMRPLESEEASIEQKAALENKRLLRKKMFELSQKCNSLHDDSF